MAKHLYQTGHPKFGGRKKGTRNVVLRNAREFALSCLSDPTYQSNLMMRLKAGKAGRMEELLWHYGYGKPVEHVELTGKDGEAIQLQEVRQATEQFGTRLLRLVGGRESAIDNGGDGDGTVGDGALRKAAS